MTNQQKTTKFFMTTAVKVQQTILDNIAGHYGITRAQAFTEVTDADAEHLCDYLTGKERTATMVLMQRKGLF